MKEQYLTEIELPVWADPQGDVILEKSRDYCYLYFDCWLEKELWINEEVTWADYIGKITFNNAWAVKSLDIEFYDIYPKEESIYKSSICRVENSLWLEEMTMKRSKTYKEWLSWDERIYKHFHFSGHDNYFDIIAENYKVEKILKKDIKHYENLWTQ
ncbi:hypothetical protein AY601_1864 [Pedobacter cryoconitis]|uniref:Uncharacterized protein n=1 Tax=Pedobacter cryoconitis TaxID=188932 RepID=A0A127VBQ0_9SPHI|nr:hypothetical protein [Pedobacter cryoconitis]AMP98773.1 hypothetical protein AY601_1864 [Pedobacter cryoconitis]